MEIEIVEHPIRFRLHGRKAAVENEQYGSVGLGLMEEIWQIVKSEQLSTTGINHWVYLADCVMFTGVELKDPQQSSAGLDLLEFNLPRYLKHVHIGHYQDLPVKWTALKQEISARGECMRWPALEVYGHHCDDPAKLETTILIGLNSPSA